MIFQNTLSLPFCCLCQMFKNRDSKQACIFGTTPINTIFLYILHQKPVILPRLWKEGYPPKAHSTWHGCLRACLPLMCNTQMHTPPMPTKLLTLLVTIAYPQSNMGKLLPTTLSRTKAKE